MREYAGYARRVFITSLFLSLCIHFVVFFLIFRSFSGRDPEFHAFILLNLGEEAMELHVGGAADMAPASASVSARTEVPEEKFELERSEPETAEFRRIDRKSVV